MQLSCVGFLLPLVITGIVFNSTTIELDELDNTIFYPDPYVASNFTVYPGGVLKLPDNTTTSEMIYIARTSSNEKDSKEARGLIFAVQDEIFWTHCQHCFVSIPFSDQTE